MNEWIAGRHPVRALHTTRTEAEKLGAMALFGEKYGDEVRVIEVEDVSRELCGGTHVSSTAEIGIFKITSESSSASNVRRIEALTGPEAIELFRAHDEALAEIAARLRTSPDQAPQAVDAALEHARSWSASCARAAPGSSTSSPRSSCARRPSATACES